MAQRISMRAWAPGTGDRVLFGTTLIPPRRDARVGGAGHRHYSFLHQPWALDATNSYYPSPLCVKEQHYFTCQVVLAVKNPPANAGGPRDAGLIPGSGRSPGEGHSNPLQYSYLENPMDRGTWQATVYRVAKSRTWLSNWSQHTHTHMLKYIYACSFVCLGVCGHMYEIVRVKG